MDVLIARLSSPGLQRELNEDSYLIIEQQNFAALFDGMGGHESGEVAGNMAKETIENLLNNSQIVDLRGFIEDSNFSLPSYAMDMVQTIRLANRRIFNFIVENTNKRGIGTTLVAIRLCSIAHVGDRWIDQNCAKSGYPINSATTSRSFGEGGWESDSSS